MSDTEKDVDAVEAGDPEEAGDVIRPVTADTEALEDGGTEYADGSRPQTAGDGDYAEGGDAAVDRPASASSRPTSARPASARPASARPESARPASARPESARPPSAKEESSRPPSAAPDAARPASARPESARPESARPESARPESARADSTRPPSARPDSAQPNAARPESARPSSARPASARPGSAKPAPVDVASSEEQQAAEGACAEGGDAKAADDAPPAGEGEAKADGEGEADPERPASSHHPDVITDINQSPEAHAEVDEMAQQQAREVIRSRQNSAGSERKSSAAEGEKRLSSASNASVRSAPPSRQGAPPNQALADMSVQPPSPSKIKTGPWLTGTYRLPKSGKIISGEELCDALERMTNAYIDKYTREKGGVPAKEIPPGAATVFNTKKLTQDEYDSMIARLYKPKDRNVADGDRISLVSLKFGDDGQEQWVPVKQVSAEEQQAYMCELYQRCLENRRKTQEELAAKYLKPLGRPRKK